MQSAINRDDLSSRLPQTPGEQEEERFRLIGWRHWSLKERAIGVELSQFCRQRLGWFIWCEGDAILCE